MVKDKKPGMLQMLKSARQLQKSMEKVEKEIREAVYTGEAAGGMVKVTLNGHHVVKKGGVFLDEEIVKEGAEVLSDLIAAAFNKAAEKIAQTSRERLRAIPQDMDFQGMFGSADEHVDD